VILENEKKNFIVNDMKKFFESGEWYKTTGKKIKKKN
jgi:hypothetical protein